MITLTPPPAEPKKLDTFPYTEAETRLHAGKKVKREQWPADMHLVLQKVDEKDTIMLVHDGHRMVPVVLHTLDKCSIDWHEKP